MNNPQLQSILQTLGERVPPASRVLLTGGSALVLLGSPRLTIDIDFVGDDVAPSELDKTIMQVARELKISVDLCQWNDSSLCLQGVTNAISALDNSGTWKYS